MGIIGPVITGNAFFPIWYHIRGFAGPRELGWSDTLYLFLESDGPVQCNAPTCIASARFFCIYILVFKSPVRSGYLVPNMVTETLTG